MTALAVGIGCGITSASALKCWGENGSGQLGINYVSTATAYVAATETISDIHTTSIATPQSVVSLSADVTSVSGGNLSACAIVSGGVKCWGNNITGQLGDNTLTASYNPIQTSGLTSGISAVSAGSNHTCAIKSDGSLVCWGQNSSGQVGDNTVNLRRVPTQVSGITSGATVVSASPNDFYLRGLEWRSLLLR